MIQISPYPIAKIAGKANIFFNSSMLSPPLWFSIWVCESTYLVEVFVWFRGCYYSNTSPGSCLRKTL